MPKYGYLFIALGLIFLAFFFIRRNYKQIYQGYKADWSEPTFIWKLVLTFVKSCISLFVIVILHNLYHLEEYTLMIVITVAFIGLAIFQSSYARIGFFSRYKFIINYIKNIFSKRNKQAKHLLDNLNNDEFNRYLIIVKVLLLFVLFFIFLSQISFFILTNLYYVIIVSSFIILSFILNSLIYFGFTSLVLLQALPEIITLGNLNLHILLVAFLIIFIGLLFDGIFTERICIIRGNYYIKNINFDSNYKFVRKTSRIAIYQNQVNNNYYVHYRTVGYVIVFESYYNAKEYKSVLNKMIRRGKRFLIKNKKELEMWL